MRRREEVQQSLLALGQPYRVPVIGAVGMGAERERIREAVGAFSRQVAAEADQFLATEGSPFVQDLILTGGGNNILGVRSALMNHLKDTCKHIHCPGPSSSGKPTCHQIGQRMVRGASALGGVSIFFDELP
jgi:Tfp pilus assembly PilM family ATPase